ncbi:MAG TPA: DinB family protein [Nocardioidaceae bacterium]|jgi:uncharacterized damage-inducible protein DinB
MTRTDTPTAWDERTTLLAFLDYTRQTARAKCEGIAAEHVGAAPLPTSPLTSIGGIVNHMRWVEHSWIENEFVGGPDLGPWTDEEPDKEFSIGAETSIEETLAAYDEQIARTDAIIAGLDLDDRSQAPIRTGERPTLRWVILHLIEENARHNGHLDILRELADGTTGD